MSKIVQAGAYCSQCNHQWVADIYRTIWVEYPQNMELVMTDSLFQFTCPACSHEQEMEFCFMATNAPKGYAVWYEPIPDAGIDADKAQYDALFGPANYFSEAPRIRNWEEFKNVLGQYERGERKGTPVDRSKFLAKMGMTTQIQDKPQTSAPNLMDRLKGLFKH